MRSFALALGILVSAAGVRAQEDPFAAIAPMVRRGDDEGAFRAIDALAEDVRSTGRARYLRGRVLERLGRPSDAAEALGSMIPAGSAAVPGVPGVAVDDARRRRVRLLARAGRCADVGQEADRLGMRAVVGECALAAGDVDAAIAALRPLREGGPGIDRIAVRIALAEALQRKGLIAEARAELLAVLVMRPDHPSAELVAEQIEELGGAAAGAVRFEVAERLDRAERLSEVRRHEDALAELDALEADRRAGRVKVAGGRAARTTAAKAVRSRELHLRGMAHYGLRRQHYADAAGLLAQAARLGGPTAAEDEFHAARALSRVDRDSEAVRAFKTFVRSHPTHRLAPEAEYLSGYIDVRRGRAEGARALRRFLGGPRATRDAERARDAAWLLAMSDFDARDFRDAAVAFERYAQLDEGAMVRGRGWYWAGRARAAAGQRDLAIAAWRQVLSIDPLHWYGLLARQRLIAAGVDVGAPLAAMSGSDAAPGAVALPEEVAFYVALGLEDDAGRALRAAESRVGGGAPGLVMAYAAVGDANRAYQLGARRRTELNRIPDARTQWAWDAAYPRPYREAIDAATTTESLPPDLLWAIMRQESGFDPDVVSNADAIGLLQLLPSTSTGLARAMGIQQFRREMLFDPDHNVRIAARYVHALDRHFAGKSVLAIMAYNAGEARIDRWLRAQQAPMELDLFVERIPIDQTRNYVRRVSSAWSRYRYLTDPQHGWPDLSLPTHVSAADIRD